MRGARPDETVVPLMRATANPLLALRAPRASAIGLAVVGAAAGAASPGVMAVVDAGAAVGTPRRPRDAVGVQRGSPVAWSAGGAMCALAGSGHDVRVFVVGRRGRGPAGADDGAPRFELLNVLRGLAAPVLRLEFAPAAAGAAAGAWLAGATACGVCVWDCRGGVEVWRRGGYEAPYGGGAALPPERSVTCTAWACGALLCVGHRYGGLELMDANAGFRSLPRVRANEYAISAMAAVPRCEALAVTGRGASVELWGLRGCAGGRPPEFLRRLEAPCGDLTALAACSAGARLMAGSRSGRILVHRARS